MKFLKRRGGAFTIAIVVVILSTIVGAQRSLGEACQEITDSFSDGVYDEAWDTTRPSISSQLETCYTSANGLYTIIVNYDELQDEADLLRQCKNDLNAATDISGKYSAYAALCDAFDVAASSVAFVELPEREQTMLDRYESNFNGAVGVISSAGYNEAVREFYRTTLDGFPTNLMKPLVSSKLPVAFGVV